MELGGKRGDGTALRMMELKKNEHGYEIHGRRRFYQ
jgi:hypothetical protein